MRSPLSAKRAPVYSAGHANAQVDGHFYSILGSVTPLLCRRRKYGQEGSRAQHIESTEHKTVPLESGHRADQRFG